jgi:hypothetical protein
VFDGERVLAEPGRGRLVRPERHREPVHA